MYQIHLKAKRADMPECTYGAACTRRNCIYKHPPKNSQKPSTDAPICTPFILGQCKFGQNCRYRHVTGEEATRILQQTARRPCRYGSACTTKDCLYQHPPKQPCRYGSRCTNINCVFAHPDPDAEEAVDSVSTGVSNIKIEKETVVFPKSEALQRKIQEEEAQSEQFVDPSVYAKHPSVRIPDDILAASWRNRNPANYSFYLNPYERFLAVNKNSPKGVIDLHYLTTDEVVDVFEAAIQNRLMEFNWEFFDETERTVYVETGAGTHTVAKNRTLIFDVMFDHLRKTGRNFKITKDDNGLYGGFLLTL